MTDKEQVELQRINILAEFKINFISTPEHEYKEGTYRLDVPTLYGRQADVRFEYAAGKGYVQLYDYPIDAKALNNLRTPQDPLSNFLSYDSEFEPTYQAICEEANSAARRAIEYVKFFLGRYEIADEATSYIDDFTWSDDLNGPYYSIPGKISWNLKIREQIPLDYEVRAQLQIGLENNILPFVAMRHIYRALQEKNPRFKWIDATIAAELAIKEALIRKEPLLAALIEHVPSPPLNKLYGEIMEKYFGVRSRFCRTVSNGASIRNKLIHQPLENKVSESEAEDYVSEVLIAINDLYSLLYPNWSVAKEMEKIRYLC